MTEHNYKVGDTVYHVLVDTDLFRASVAESKVTGLYVRLCEPHYAIIGNDGIVFEGDLFVTCSLAEKEVQSRIDQKISRLEALKQNIEYGKFQHGK